MRRRGGKIKNLDKKFKDRTHIRGKMTEHDLKKNSKST